MKNIFLLILVFPLWVIYFLSGIIPRDNKLIAFGTHTKSFSGNIKSLFINNDISNYKKIFISDNKVLVDELVDQGHQAYMKITFKGIWYSLKSGTFIYSGFPSDINFWLSYGTKYINVWHGTPIKKIERDVTTGKYSLKNKYPWIFKILKPYLLSKPDILLVSSPHEEKCFKSAFGVNDENIFRAFPPRLLDLLEDNIYNKEKNILYVPTWRDDHSFSFSDHINLNSFNKFLHKNNMHLTIKLHPSDKSLENIHQKFSNIEIIDQNQDVYTLLKKSSIVLSDYSSMVFEALYLSKPVILFCPDYDTYQKNSREFYIDPCKDLPVEVSFLQTELEEKLLKIDKSSIDINKFKPYEPYGKIDNLLEKLMKKAHT